MLTATLSLFDDEFLKKLEYLNIISKRLFAGQLRAERRTRKRGTGLEFADYRAYVAGDDFRPLDWKAYLRLKDRKSTRLNSSHLVITYAAFCLTKKTSAQTTISELGTRHRPSA